MSHLNLENQIFLLDAIKKTNEYFGEDELVSNENHAVKKVNDLFIELKNMEDRLNYLSGKNK